MLPQQHQAQYGYFAFPPQQHFGGEWAQQLQLNVQPTQPYLADPWSAQVQKPQPTHAAAALHGQRLSAPGAPSAATIQPAPVLSHSQFSPFGSPRAYQERRQCQRPGGPASSISTAAGGTNRSDAHSQHSPHQQHQQQNRPGSRWSPAHHGSGALLHASNPLGPMEERFRALETVGTPLPEVTDADVLLRSSNITDEYLEQIISALRRSPPMGKRKKRGRQGDGLTAACTDGVEPRGSETSSATASQISTSTDGSGLDSDDSDTGSLCHEVTALPHSQCTAYDSLDTIAPNTVLELVPQTAAQIAAKRDELVESPTSKALFRDFEKQLKEVERSAKAGGAAGICKGRSSAGLIPESFVRARQFTLDSLREGRVTRRVYWRVLLALADLARRENLIDEAAYWFHKANQLQPFSAQGWLDHAKMEEECGRMEVCQRLLHLGLRFCPHNEPLLVKCVKYQEQAGGHALARSLLARLQHVRLEKGWKVVLEGALFEARAGRISVARKVFQYLMKHIPLHGPVYYEAYKLEEKCEQFTRARDIVERGLVSNPRYGPLWFGALRLYERMITHERSHSLQARLVQLREEQHLAEEGSGGPLPCKLCAQCPYCVSPTDSPTPTPSPPSPQMEPSQQQQSPQQANSVATPLGHYVATIHCPHCLLGQDPPLLDLALSPPSLEEGEAPVDLTPVHNVIQRAVQNISSELIWKVYFEAAQIEERANNPAAARKSYALAAMNCLSNLRWKVWLGGARLELNSGNVAVARQLLERALAEVPSRTRALVLLECARLEECSGDLDRARAILRRAQNETKHEWKVFLESILLETRAGNIAGAIEAASSALEIHRGAGRLWAMLIHLKQTEGEAAQQAVFREALKEVPKSGEVWCEGARMCMNPLAKSFNLQRARQFLDFAIKFTPQYGDSFIEYLRLELLTTGMAINSRLEQLCVNAEPNYGPLWYHCKFHALHSTRQVLRTAKWMLQTEMARHRDVYQQAIVNSQSRNKSSKVRRQYKSFPLCTFATALPSLNYIYMNAHKSPHNPHLRRKLIFGAEQIFCP